MSDVKWIKLTVDMFSNRKITHLRKLPDGNNIVLIWVMLLTMAGRCNANGLIFLTENIPYTPKMLADELGFEENTVLLALEALEQFDMIVTKEKYFSIASWDEYQNAEGLEKIREQNRKRQATFKERQKEKQKALLGNVTDNVIVTQGNATDIEEDKEKEIELYKSIVEYLNEKAATNFRHSSSKTRTCIHARLAEGFALEDFKKVIDNQCADWLGTKYEKYLRPETLFGTKFEGYLNAKTTRKDGGAGARPNIESSGNIAEQVGTWL